MPQVAVLLLLWQQPAPGSRRQPAAKAAVALLERWRLVAAVVLPGASHLESEEVQQHHLRFEELLQRQRQQQLRQRQHLCGPQQAGTQLGPLFVGSSAQEPPQGAKALAQWPPRPQRPLWQLPMGLVQQVPASLRPVR